MRDTPPTIDLATASLAAGLLPFLRAQTHDLHERIESRLDLPTRLTTEREYRYLLERFFTYYAPLEEILGSIAHRQHWATLDIDFDKRRKTWLLRLDMVALGVTDEALSALPLCPIAVLPQPTSVPELIGCVYVLEGATLGGKLIGKHVENRTGLRPGEPGARFFNAYGASTGEMWQEFRRAAERYARSQDTGDGVPMPLANEAVASARQTFSSLEGWLLT